MLWEIDEDGEERFIWNSAIGESSNSSLSRLRPVLKRMPHDIGSFVLFTTMTIHNEFAYFREAEDEESRFPLVVEATSRCY